MRHSKYKQDRYHRSQQSNRVSKGGESDLTHFEPVQCIPLEVQVHDNFDRAFRAFRALVQKERILSDYKERQSYEKPSDKARRLKNEAIRKRMQEQDEEENPKKFVRKERKDKSEKPTGE